MAKRPPSVARWFERLSFLSASAGIGLSVLLYLQGTRFSLYSGIVEKLAANAEKPVGTAMAASRGGQPPTPEPLVSTPEDWGQIVIVVLLLLSLLTLWIARTLRRHARAP